MTCIRNHNFKVTPYLYPLNQEAGTKWIKNGSLLQYYLLFRYLSHYMYQETQYNNTDNQLWYQKINKCLTIPYNFHPLLIYSICFLQ